MRGRKRGKGRFAERCCPGPTRTLQGCFERGATSGWRCALRRSWPCALLQMGQGSSSFCPLNRTRTAVCLTKEKAALVASMRAAFKSGKGWFGVIDALAPCATYIVTPRGNPKGPQSQSAALAPATKGPEKSSHDALDGGRENFPGPLVAPVPARDNATIRR